MLNIEEWKKKQDRERKEKRIIEKISVSTQ